MPKAALFLAEHVFDFTIKELRLESEDGAERFNEIARGILLACFAQRHQCSGGRYRFTNFLLCQTFKFSRNL